MNVKEYISSGILEMYVMGLLNEEETMMVEEYAQQYPEIKEEIELIQSSLIEYSERDIPEPPDAVRENIFNDLYKTPAKTVSPVKKIISQSIYKTKYFAAACLALFLLSGIVNILLWMDLSERKTVINELSDANKRLTEENKSIKTSLDKTNNQVQMVMNPDYKVVKLKGLEKSPGSMAVVYWDEKSKHVYLDPVKLPAAPRGKQYQLWAIVDGKPVDAGVIGTQTEKGMVRMKTMDVAQAFAVTLEPEGGSINPTMTEMYVMGQI